MKLLRIFNNLLALMMLIALPLFHNTHLTYGSQTTIQAQEPSYRSYFPILMKARAYYVAATGNDANPGSLELPWRTIRKAALTAVAGDTVFVRGGVYAEVVSLDHSGTAALPIQFTAYPGEIPVVDGANVTISNWGAMFSLTGNYVQAAGFEIRNAKFIGAIIKGQHNIVSRFYIHHSQQNGILISGDYGTVQDSRIWRNALANEYGKASQNSTGISAARDVVDGITDYAVIRRNTVWENWGEGISSFEANQVILEGNIAHDNYTANIYISDSTNVLCQGNFVYMDPASYMNDYGSNVGIMLGDENYTPASANIQVLNNLGYGNHRNFFWWQGSKGGGMNNVLIANNTFVNGTGSGYDGGVIIGQGNHQNVRFENNIVQQDNALTVVATVAMNGVIYSHNLFSKTPLSAAAGAGDIISDPKLAKSGNPFSAAWYNLTASSPAINRALSIPEVVIDYPGKSRGNQPDIGAIEY